MLKHGFFLSIICWLLLPACHSAQNIAASEKTPPAPPPFVTWDKKTIDLGSVKKGEHRSMVYEFTNTSGETAQIDIVDACECTKVEFPRGPVEPGQKGRLDVVFDSTEKNAAETISINVIFKNTHPNGVPRIEIVEYKFDLIK